jgi:hypothetical protein
MSQGFTQIRKSKGRSIEQTGQLEPGAKQFTTDEIGSA